MTDDESKRRAWEKWADREFRPDIQRIGEARVSYGPFEVYEIRPPSALAQVLEASHQQGEANPQSRWFAIIYTASSHEEILLYKWFTYLPPQYGVRRILQCVKYWVDATTANIATAKQALEINSASELASTIRRGIDNRERWVAQVGQAVRALEQSQQ